MADKIDAVLDIVTQMRAEMAELKPVVEGYAERDESLRNILKLILSTVKEILAGMGQEDDDKGRDKLTKTLNELKELMEGLEERVPVVTSRLILAGLDGDGTAKESPKT